MPFKERLRFAAADFGFNVYWQSLTLYLLFHYTESVGLTMTSAAAIFAVGSVVDGIADLVVSIHLDRGSGVPGRYAGLIRRSALPLAGSFVLLFAPPLLPAGAGLLLVALVHLLFRVVYAMGNIPYTALIAQVTPHSFERASIAGWRMFFGTVAAGGVALLLTPLTCWFGGEAAHGAVKAAAVFAGPATLLILQALRVTPATAKAATLPPPLRDQWRGIAGNGAFLGLLAGMAAMIVAATALTRITLYAFRYDVGDAAAGDHALVMLGLAGGAAIPLWMRLNRRRGGRAVWLTSCGLGLAATFTITLADRHSVVAAQAYFAAMQVALVGTNLAFWSLLPDTLEYGEWATGVRVEATLFGLAAMAQKLALAAAVAAFGLAFDAIGYHAGVSQTPRTIAGMRAIMLGVPAAALAVSAACIAFSPMRRGAHGRILAALAARADRSQAS